MLIAARTHDYGKQPIDRLAGLLKSEGIDAAQLVLPKGFTEINSYDEVTPEIIERIRSNFEKEGVKITGGSAYAKPKKKLETLLGKADQ